jgi:hypothetical protein
VNHKSGLQGIPLQTPAFRQIQLRQNANSRFQINGLGILHGRLNGDSKRLSTSQTIAAPYSLRPRPGATVSTPLEWREVKKGLRPRRFTIKTIFRRLKTKGDLLKPILQRTDLHRVVRSLETDSQKTRRSHDAIKTACNRCRVRTPDRAARDISCDVNDVIGGFRS